MLCCQFANPAHLVLSFTEPHSWLQYCCGSVTPPAVRDDAQAHPTRGWSQIGQGCFSSNRHLQLGASGQQVHDPLLPQAGLEVVLLHLIKHACQQVLLGAQPLFVSLDCGKFLHQCTPCRFTHTHRLTRCRLFKQQAGLWLHPVLFFFNSL